MMASTAGMIVEDYLRRMVDILGTGGVTSESSYYSALDRLLNDVGKPLDTQMICNGQVRQIWGDRNKALLKNGLGK